MIKLKKIKTYSVKGLLDYAIKIAATWVACKKLHTRIARSFIYTTHPIPSNFYNIVSVIVFQFVQVYLKSDTAYRLNFTKTICII